MREIKFRCWCMNKNEWERDMILLTPNGGICQLKDNLHIPCRSDTHVIQLFTGLSDRQGKEIYEGDIVKVIDRDNIGVFNVPDDVIANSGYTGREDVFKGEVIYVPCVFGLRTEGCEKDEIEIHLACGEDRIIEVIGNIYENPELLEGSGNA